MPRPFTRPQALQNQAFLRALRRTGNVHEAARALGVHRSTYTKRRARDPAFAARWDAALAVAQARILAREPVEAATDEPQVVRTRAGLQLRRQPKGKLTRAVEQAFLTALSATANVRLAAAATGLSHGAFYARRKRNPGFAREMRLALEMGYERLELALIESFTVEAHVDDAWRHNAPPPIPAMTANQALQLLYLHQKEARLMAEPEHIRRRRGESAAAHSVRLAAMYEAGLERDREAFALAEAARRDREGAPDPAFATPALPALDQVTGWSTAAADAAVACADVAMFGGRRFGRR